MASAIVHLAHRLDQLPRSDLFRRRNFYVYRASCVNVMRTTAAHSSVAAHAAENVTSAQSVHMRVRWSAQAAVEICWPII